MFGAVPSLKCTTGSSEVSSVFSSPRNFHDKRRPVQLINAWASDQPGSVAVPSSYPEIAIAVRIQRNAREACANRSGESFVHCPRGGVAVLGRERDVALGLARCSRGEEAEADASVPCRCSNTDELNEQGIRFGRARV